MSQYAGADIGKSSLGAVRLSIIRLTFFRAFQGVALLSFNDGTAERRR